jgi:putative FmdB family regulatory protein
VPTYEYTCRDCGHTFEIVQSMWDEPLTMCPECGGSLRKVFAPPAISFKGSGFYATDHGKKAKKPSEGIAASKDGPSEGGTSSEGSKAGSGKDGSKNGSSVDGAGGSGKGGSSASKKEPAAS